MEVTKELELCNLCALAAINDDTSGLPEAMVSAINEGLSRLGPHLVPSFDFDSGEGVGFGPQPCACCNSALWGARYLFATLA